MNTKEEIKDWIIKEMVRVKDFPDLNYPSDLGKDFNHHELKEVDLWCFRYGKTLTRIWVQQKNNRLLLPDMPETISELCIELKEVHKLDIDIISNISQFCECYTRWKNLYELINGTPITFESMFKWKGDCTRITNVILKGACKDGIFVKFPNIDGTEQNQLYILVDVIFTHYVKDEIARKKGDKEIAKKIFFKKFGWNAYREGSEKTGLRDIVLKTSYKKIYAADNNTGVKRDIELYLLDSN